MSKNSLFPNSADSEDSEGEDFGSIPVKNEPISPFNPNIPHNPNAPQAQNPNAPQAQNPNAPPPLNLNVSPSARTRDELISIHNFKFDNLDKIDSDFTHDLKVFRIVYNRFVIEIQKKKLQNYENKEFLTLLAGNLDKNYDELFTMPSPEDLDDEFQKLRDTITRNLELNNRYTENIKKELKEYTMLYLAFMSIGSVLTNLDDLRNISGISTFAKSNIEALADTERSRLRDDTRSYPKPTMENIKQGQEFYHGFAATSIPNNLDPLNNDCSLLLIYDLVLTKIEFLINEARYFLNRHLDAVDRKSIAFLELILIVAYPIDQGMINFKTDFPVYFQSIIRINDQIITTIFNWKTDHILTRDIKTIRRQFDQFYGSFINVFKNIDNHPIRFHLGNSRTMKNLDDIQIFVESAKKYYSSLVFTKMKELVEYYCQNDDQLRYLVESYIENSSLLSPKLIPSIKTSIDNAYNSVAFNKNVKQPKTYFIETGPENVKNCFSLITKAEHMLIERDNPKQYYYRNDDKRVEKVKQSEMDRMYLLLGIEIDLYRSSSRNQYSSPYLPVVIPRGSRLFKTD